VRRRPITIYPLLTTSRRRRESWWRPRRRPEFDRERANNQERRTAAAWSPTTSGSLVDQPAAPADAPVPCRALSTALRSAGIERRLGVRPGPGGLVDGGAWPVSASAGDRLAAHPGPPSDPPS
jgi:hypothetical protein